MRAILLQYILDMRLSECAEILEAYGIFDDQDQRFALTNLQYDLARGEL